MLPVTEAPTLTRPVVAIVAGKSVSASEAPFAPSRITDSVQVPSLTLSVR